MSKIQPGNQNPRIFHQNVESIKHNEYHILCDLKTTNENESGIKPEMTGSENPKVFQPTENDSPEQNVYHVLCDLKSENESSVQPVVTGSGTPKLFQQEENDSTEKNEYHILCDMKPGSGNADIAQSETTENISAEQNEYHVLYQLKPANDSESCIQSEMTGSEYTPASRSNVDSTATDNCNASPGGYHPPPGGASRFGLEEGEYDELKLQKV